MAKKKNKNDEWLVDDENIQNVDYSETMHQSYIDYSMSVITERALPDVTDGLKPVQRRVLTALSTLAKPKDPYRKCARIVGDTMGKFHPHGDSSIYECLVNLSQPWKATLPLIKGHGNFGSVSGDGAAAMRYTEAKMSQYIEDVCLKDINFYKEYFVPNFDGTETEPTFLPFQVPNLLVNGSTGIAVGMATNIPSHNLGEIIDATIMYLKDSDISTEELLEVVQGPDFATGGIINTTKEELLSIYETGMGKLKVRGKVEVRDIGYGRKSICVTEIPVSMIGNTEKFLYKIADLVRNHEIDGVLEIADRGGSDGECLCIDVKKMSDESIQNIINILYKKAGLEDTFGVNINCINDGKPEVMGIKRVLELYTEFKKKLYNVKYSKLLLEEENSRETKQGLLEAVDVIDLIIEILRGSKKVADAKKCLMYGDTSNIKFRFKGSEADAKELRFTERQAEAILSMRLQKLIGLEIDVLKKELKQVEDNIKKYTKLLNNEKSMKELMISDMLLIKEKYATKRKSKIVECEEIKLKKAEVVASDVVVLLDRFYYLKVIDEATFKRNEENIIKEYRHFVPCTNLGKIGIFASNNQMYMIKVSDIIKVQSKKSANNKKTSGSVVGKLSDKGIQVFDFCNMNGDENILFMTGLEEISDKNLIFLCDNGTAKRVSGSAFDISKKSCSASKEGENIVYVNEVKDNDFLIIKSRDGYYARLSVGEIGIKGKTAACSKAIVLNADDTIEKAITSDLKGTLSLDDKEIPVSKIKLIKKGNKGTKMRI